MTEVKNPRTDQQAIYKLQILHPNTAIRLRMQPLMHAMAGIIFMMCVVSLLHLQPPQWSKLFLFLLLGILCITFPFTLQRARHISGSNTIFRLIESLGLMAAAVFFLLHHYPMLAITLFTASIGFIYLCVAEYRIFQPNFVIVESQGIYIPALFTRRHFKWSQLNNVVLRHDLLTLDFKNDKLLQLEVLTDMGPAEVQELNDFCARQLMNQLR